MNTQETAAVLRILRTVWPKTPLTDDTIRAYQWAFEDLPYELVEDAAKQWLRDGTFFPKPSELLEIVRQAPAPTSASSSPGKREGTSYFATGVVRRGDGLPRGHLWTVADEEVTGVVFHDGGGWCLRPVDQVTDADLAMIRQPTQARKDAA